MVDLSCDASLVVMEHAMTGRDTPHARPKAILLFVGERKEGKNGGEGGSARYKRQGRNMPRSLVRRDRVLPQTRPKRLL